MQRMMPIRIGIFYDGNYILHTSNYYNYVHYQKKRLNVSGINLFVRNTVARDAGVDHSDCLVCETHYFRGRLNASEAQQRGNQLYNDRVFEDILMAEGVHTHYLPLRNVNGRREERGIDLWLALEAYEAAINRGLDYVVLVISDADYIPLLRKLTGRGVKTILLSWDFEFRNEDGALVVTRTAQDLLSLANCPLQMHEIIERGLREEDPEILRFFSQNTLVRPFVDPIADAPEVRKRVRTGEVQKTEVSEVFSVKQGYGFIKYPNNNLFFHYQDVLGDPAELMPHDPVEFVIGKNAEGNDVAKEVRKLSIDRDFVREQQEEDNKIFDWKQIEE